ncbi:GAF and ANTAR domain-containing protein [Aquipuribacter sp. SD81]|uniref:GAF and ANTAR domain-containing protein n=1 Tax=Aquipuribacter sp. SD81 TaxID=3127703 RepID=UPI003015A8A7
MNSTVRLASVFVELADTLVERFDIVDFVQVLAERSVELLGADAAGLMLADERGGLRLMASTLERMRHLETFELQIDEGPCRDCFETGVAVANVRLADARERWPRFTEAALAAGFGSTHALPMRLRGRVIGALNLFTDADQRMSEEDLQVGQAMADVATIGLLQERSLQEQTVLSEQLQYALHSRVQVELAKGMLSERAGVSLEEAFRRMRLHARGRGLPLTQVAGQVIDGTLVPDGPAAS